MAKVSEALGGVDMASCEFLCVSTWGVCLGAAHILVRSPTFPL